MELMAANIERGRNAPGGLTEPQSVRVALISGALLFWVCFWFCR
jgi:hypothetical protein